MGTADHAAPNQTAALGTDHDPVFDLGDAWRRPGDALRFLALDPGANGTFQYHLATVRFDRDPIGVDLGISLECVHDLAFKICGFHLGLHRDHVGDPLHPFHPPHSGVSGVFLILPLHRTFEGNPAILDDDLDPVVRDRQFSLQGRNRISRNIRIGTLIDRWQPDFDIIRDCVYSGDPLRGGFGFKPVGVTGGEARQRDNAILDGDGNVIRIEIGIPFQLVPDVAFYFTVGFHVWLLVCTKADWRARLITPPIARNL